METKDILKKLRNDKGETLSELSQKVGISQPTLSRYEKGTRKPKYDQLERLAAHFSVTIDYLAGKSDDPQMMAKKGPVTKFVSSFAPSFGVYPTDETRLRQFKYLQSILIHGLPIPIEKHELFKNEAKNLSNKDKQHIALIISRLFGALIHSYATNDKETINSIINFASNLPIDDANEQTDNEK
ncbi:hypothetical protein C6P21_01195 [Weissella confusa]|uniref:helix-turn-helix domain-containing protein n=1 Tax=Weissella confusa TaxID=1583 RepID=UPI0010806010|nr:helix-turn-helix transcriptional regulator [Weissella confusa]TGE62791.1 hypothetical protein C6P21_01195 [Weissella confusa]